MFKTRWLKYVALIYILLRHYLGGSVAQSLPIIHCLWRFAVKALQSNWRRLCSVGLPSYCPARRTSLIATRFWVVMICPIIKCLTVLRVFFYFVWFVFIHHNFQFYFELCTYCNILDIYLSQNLNFVNYLLFYMKLLNYLFFNMFGSVLECCELIGVSLL